jgi:flagellar biosynthesis chaperone FliJ
MLDSLFDYKQQIVQLDKELLDLKKEVDQLRISFEQNQKALAVSEAKNEVIGFLWFEVNKEYYQFFVWSFMAALLAIVLILYFRIKHVCAVVKRVKAAYSKIMDEYRMQRHQSIEKQIKLKREIQTIQNRLEMIQSLEESSSS